MRRPRRRAAVSSAVLVAVFMAIGAADSAQADFTPATLISGSTTVESDYAGEPVISADGAYVAFVGSQLGVQGIWRKDLATGELDLVAGGDASAPSISADGRFVSFTTTSTDQVTGAGKQCPSVYVRDMSQSIATDPPPAGAFTLASAPNGSASSLVYAGSSSPGSCPGGGSAAAPRVALSAAGNEVVFTVDGQSNLTTGGDTVGTPPAQVAVRYLSTQQTVLVSQTMSSIGSSTPQPVPGGGALTDGLPSGVDDTGGAGNQYADPDSTAAISADGSTVAWQGIEIPTQASAAPADSPGSHPFDYSEPLWRRIADGPSAPTRRVTGGDDPVGPCPGGCSGPLDTFWVNPGVGPTEKPNGPSAGTLFAPGGLNAATPFGVAVNAPLDDATPQLSGNGQTVAILSTQPSTGADPACGFNGCGSSPQTTNAFVVNMAGGLSRTAALIRLTQWAANNFDQVDGPLSARIDDVAISPEGDRVAFVTQRSVFPFSPPALLTPQLSPGPFQQLYVANLADGTLEAASIGYDGNPANGNVMEPSFSADNGPIAFASQATNLVFGAFSEVTGGYEAFTISEFKPAAIPGGSYISPSPQAGSISPDWQLSATSARGSHGSVLLWVTVPGAGRLSAVATAGVPIARLSHHTRRRRGQRVTTIRLARARATTDSPGVVELRLVPAARYGSAFAGRQSLYATARITFVAAGRSPLVELLPLNFFPRSRAGRASRRARAIG